MRFFAVLLLLALPAVAQDANKMLEQAKKLEAKAEKLLDQGKRTEAFDTLARAAELREKAKNPKGKYANLVYRFEIEGCPKEVLPLFNAHMAKQTGKADSNKDAPKHMVYVHRQLGYFDAKARLATKGKLTVLTVEPGTRYRIKSPVILVELGQKQDDKRVQGDKLGTQLQGLHNKLDGKPYQSSEVTKISRQMVRVLRKGGFKNAQVELTSSLDGSAKTIGLVFRAHSGAGKKPKSGAKRRAVDPTEAAHLELDLALKAGNVAMARKASDKLRKARTAQARRISALEKQLRGMERQLAEIRRMLDIEKPG